VCVYIHTRTHTHKHPLSHAHSHTSQGPQQFMCGSCMSHESRMNESYHKCATSYTPATAPALRGIDAQSSRAHIRVISHITGPTAVYVWLTCPSRVADALYRHLPRLSLSLPFVPPRLFATPRPPFSGSRDFAWLVFILAYILHVSSSRSTFCPRYNYHLIPFCLASSPSLCVHTCTAEQSSLINTHAHTHTQPAYDISTRYLVDRQRAQDAAATNTIYYKLEKNWV